MAVNPFAGTDFEQSWQEGFVAGYLAPDDDHSAPSPFTIDRQAVYEEGVLTGRQFVGPFRIPPQKNTDHNETWETIVHIIVEIAEIGHAAFEISEGANVIGTMGASAIFSFMSIAIFGPTQLPFFEEAAAEAVRGLLQQLSNDGVISQNIELFMAACNRTDHVNSPTSSDALTIQGWWHGSVFLNFEQALSEGQAHEHPDETRILRFQSVAPDVIDVIDLNTFA